MNIWKISCPHANKKFSKSIMLLMNKRLLSRSFLDERSQWNFGCQLSNKAVVLIWMFNEMKFFTQNKSKSVFSHRKLLHLKKLIEKKVENLMRNVNFFIFAILRSANLILEKNIHFLFEARNTTTIGSVQK